jgi:hypothetical protein
MNKPLEKGVKRTLREGPEENLIQSFREQPDN